MVTLPKKTRKQLAGDLKISVKTMRESIRYTENMERIEANIGAERAKQFNDIVAALQSNKKERINTNKNRCFMCLVKDMNIEVGDIIKLKKKHPCGSFEWEVLRVGMDFRLKCMGCEHQVMLARKLVEKNLKGIRKPE